MKLHSIKTALFLSFSTFLGLTLIAVISSWYSFNELHENQLNVVSKNIPALIKSTERVELSNLLSTQTTRIISAETASELSINWSQLSNSIKQMSLAITDSQKKIPVHNLKQLDKLFKQLKENLFSIKLNISQSLLINQAIFENKIRLEWAKNDALDEIDPLLEDKQFYIQLLLKQKSDSNTTLLQQQITELVLMSSIRSQINLISDIVTRTSDLKNGDQLTTNQLYTSQLIVKLQKEHQKLQANSSTLSITQNMNELFQFISGDNNLFQMTTTRLKLYQASLNLLSENQNLLSQFNQQIKNHAIAEEKKALQNSHHATRQIQKSQFILFIVSIISLIIALLVGWLYVERYLVQRIISLHNNMRLIADGHMDTSIATSGYDEISDMAKSLDTFRNTLEITQRELIQAGKLAALGELSAGVAHELNQPLAAIRNYLHNTRLFIQRDNKNAATENLQDIDSLTQRMSEIIKQFKDFSRKSSKSLQAVSISLALDNVLSLLDNQLRKNNINFCVHPYDRSLQARAELIRLEQVLVNIISNAIDAMSGKNSDKNLQIFVDKKDTEDNITIHIVDNGIGINDDNKDLIFEPFFTSKKPGSGLGLGLSISYNIVKDFGGNLSYKNNKIDGTEFIIKLKVD
jgi:two-component system C4-dicarboxylate transport sensor histidine kinase DctB